MKHRIERSMRNNQGSISLEAALLIPVFTGILLFFLSLFQIAAARNLLELSAIRTADEMCRWAPVYRNEFLKEVSSQLLEEIGGEFADSLQIKEKADGFIGKILNLRNASEYSHDFIYGFAAQSLCNSYFEADPLVQSGIIRHRDLNLYKSVFFHNDTDRIRLTATCVVDTYLPFPIRLGFTVRCSAWGGGRTPRIQLPDSAEETSGIWAENNFTRGKILRQMYGGNLPESFPVIAAFENGTAIMIKSLNHTMNSYKDSGALEKTIRDMIDTLASFEGAEYGGIVIEKHDILRKKLILILPENDYYYSQEAVIQHMMQYSMMKFIVLDLQRYQKV